VYTGLRTEWTGEKDSAFQRGFGNFGKGAVIKAVFKLDAVFSNGIRVPLGVFESPAKKLDEMFCCMVERCLKIYST
jgi:fumarate reductase subunit D